MSSTYLFGDGISGNPDDAWHRVKSGLLPIERNRNRRRASSVVPVGIHVTPVDDPATLAVTPSLKHIDIGNVLLYRGAACSIDHNSIFLIDITELDIGDRDYVMEFLYFITSWSRPDPTGNPVEE